MANIQAKVWGLQRENHTVYLIITAWAFVIVIVVLHYLTDIPRHFYLRDVYHTNNQRKLALIYRDRLKYSQLFTYNLRLKCCGTPYFANVKIALTIIIIIIIIIIVLTAIQEVPGSIPGYTLEIFLEVQGLERDPPSLVRAIGQLLDMTRSKIRLRKLKLRLRDKCLANHLTATTSVGIGSSELQRHGFFKGMWIILFHQC